MDQKSARVNYPNNNLELKFEIWVSRGRELTQTELLLPT